MTHGTMADTAGATATTHGTTEDSTTHGTEDGTEVSMTLGTIVPGIQDSTIHIITICIRTIAAGTEDGDRTTAASTTDRHMEEATLQSAAERYSEDRGEKPQGEESPQA